MLNHPSITMLQSRGRECSRIGRKGMEKKRGAPQIGTGGRIKPGDERSSEASKMEPGDIQETIGRASPRTASCLGSHFTQRRTARWLAIVRRIFYTV